MSKAATLALVFPKPPYCGQITWWPKIQHGPGDDVLAKHISFDRARANAINANAVRG